MKSIGPILAALIGLLFFSCKHTVSPPEKKSPREYTWTKTTIGNQGLYQVIPHDVWGSSPKDVYVVSHAALFEGKILHFDGLQWTDISTKYIEAYGEAHPGVQVFNWDPNAVWGFGPNEVWIAGSRDTSSTSQELKQGFVVHFNGTSWQEVAIPGAANLYGLWGTSSSDIWTCGILGKLYHFNGTTWTDFPIGDSIAVTYFVGITKSRLYAYGANLSNTIYHNILLEWYGSGWSIVEVAPETSPDILFQNVNAVGDNLYTSTADAVKKRINVGSWSPVILDNSPSWRFNQAKGLSESNFFAVGGPGEIIIHFNGSDWRRLTQFSDSTIFYYNLIVFDSEVFVIGTNIASTYGFVLHGK